MLELVSSILKKEGEKGVKDYFILYYKVLLIKVRSIILPTAGFNMDAKAKCGQKKNPGSVFLFYLTNKP